MFFRIPAQYSLDLSLFDWNIPCADIYHPRYIYQQIPYIRYLCITKYKIFGIDYDKF